MPLNPDNLLNWRFEPREDHLLARDCMLYAISLGLGADRTDKADLRFVYERDLAVFPTMPVVLGHPGPWQDDPRAGVTRSKVVHGEQGLVVHAPLRPGRRVRAQNAISDVIDKGRDKGALILMTRDLTDAETGESLASMTSTVFCRADGGFAEARPSPRDQEPWPERRPDAVRTIGTAPGAALLYRLNGDYNPVHADPDVANAAGFERPILHGLCTFGLAGVALLREFGGGDPLALRSLSVRFSAPVLPGDTVRFEFWRDGENVRFRASSPSGALVLNEGRACVRPA